MSNTRNICNALTKGFVSLKDTVFLRQNEAKRLLLPVMLSATSASVLALPSIAYAVFADSLLPTYMVRGVVIGSVLGVANVIRGRFVEESNPLNKKSFPLQTKNYASLIQIDGIIDKALSKKTLPLLKKAFQDKDSAGVVLQINSPGGSPVQSSIIYNEIVKLKKQYKKKVVVVGEDSLASGAYYVAMAADSIYVNATTITGSIGVVASSFGLGELAKKIGIEHRIHAAGDLKHRSDVFSPESKEDVQKTDEILKQVHDDFIATVVASRKDKLIEFPDKPKLFSGDYWTGKKALELGLVDRLGSVSDALENEFGVDKSKEYEASNVIKSIFGVMSSPKLEVSLALDDANKFNFT